MTACPPARTHHTIVWTCEPKSHASESQLAAQQPLLTFGKLNLPGHVLFTLYRQTQMSERQLYFSYKMVRTTCSVLDQSAGMPHWPIFGKSRV